MSGVVQARSPAADFISRMLWGHGFVLGYWADPMEPTA
ncbi:hypothetical protein RKD05_001771 [Microbacterium sp. SLBN-111]